MALVAFSLLGFLTVLFLEASTDSLEQASESLSVAAAGAFLFNLQLVATKRVLKKDDNIQMSNYFQSLTFYLYEKGLLSDELKAVLHEHDNALW